jgi:Glycosyl hydrolase family 3 N terminal domain
VPARHGRRRLLILVLAVLALGAGVAGAVVGAGQDDEEGDAAPTATPGRGAPEERISFLARIVPPEARREPGGRRSTVPPRVAAITRRMSLERKVAQLFLLGFRGTDLTAEIFGRLRRLDLGGLVLAGPNYVDSAQLTQLAGEAAVIARDARHLAPWVLAIQEGGDLNSFLDLPPSLAPADLGSADEAAAEASAAGSALRSVGVNGVLGPVVDVGLESGTALGARVYSDDP